MTWGRIEVDYNDIVFTINAVYERYLAAIHANKRCIDPKECRAAMFRDEAICSEAGIDIERRFPFPSGDKVVTHSPVKVVTVHRYLVCFHSFTNSLVQRKSKRSRVVAYCFELTFLGVEAEKLIEAL